MNVITHWELFAAAGGDAWFDRLRGLIGAVCILGALTCCSAHRAAIRWRRVGVGLALQLALGLFLLWVPAGRALVGAAAALVNAVLQCTQAGTTFVFGSRLVDPEGPVGFVFAFRVLPTVIFVAALFAVLYHLGVMQVVVRAFAWVMLRLLGSSGAESLNAAASVFLGQTEAPLTIRPYLPRLTRSELFVVMVSGMGLVAGGVLGAYIESGARATDLITAILMSAPACIFLAKIVEPETGLPETLGSVRMHDARTDANLLDAAARGTREGLSLALNIAAMLIAFLALIALMDLMLGSLGGWIGRPDLSLQLIFGLLLAPLAWLLGVSWADAQAVGALLGKRLVLNEVIAYLSLGELASRISPRSYSIATIALCGFANISSIGIQIGGIGPLLPENRRHEIAVLGVRALLTATLVNYLSAAIAGVFL